jgi:hypothetical protein
MNVTSGTSITPLRQVVRVERKWNRDIKFFIPPVWGSSLLLTPGEKIALAYSEHERSYLLIVPAASVHQIGYPCRFSKSGSFSFRIRAGWLFVKQAFSHSGNNAFPLREKIFPSPVHISRSPSGATAIAIFWPGLHRYQKRFDDLSPSGKELSLLIPRWY